MAGTLLYLLLTCTTIATTMAPAKFVSPKIKLKCKSHSEITAKVSVPRSAVSVEAMMCKPSPRNAYCKKVDLATKWSIKPCHLKSRTAAAARCTLPHNKLDTNTYVLKIRVTVKVKYMKGFTTSNRSYTTRGRPITPAMICILASLWIGYGGDNYPSINILYISNIYCVVSLINLSDKKEKTKFN